MTRNLSVIVLVSLLLSACTQTPSTSQKKALPRDWYDLPEKSPKGSASSTVELSKPTPEAEKNVQALFRAHTRALESVRFSPERLQALAPGVPANWVPWHLEGLIASFGVSIDGVLGALLGEGTASLKGTWRRVGASGEENAPAPTLAARPRVLRVTPRSTALEITQQIEPSVRAAVASGAIQGIEAEANLRSNLYEQAQKFRTLTVALSSAQISNKWKLESYRMDLNFDASGSLTPVTRVGTNINFRMDWEKGEGSEGEASDGAAPSDSGSPLQKNLQGFVNAVAEDIDEATTEDHPAEGSKFDLHEVRIGLAISAAGDVGIATDQLSVTGSLTFSKEESEAEGSHPIPSISSPETLNALSVADNARKMRVAQANAVDFRKLSADTPSDQPSPSLWDLIVYKVKRGQFRHGLARAIEMGRYFADHGAQAEEPASKWKLDEVEAEFDLSVSGTLGVTTITGTGEVALSFAPKE